MGRDVRRSNLRCCRISPISTTTSTASRSARREAEHDRQDQTDGELGLQLNRSLTSDLTLETLALQHVNKTGYRSLFDTDTDAEDFGETDLSTETIVRGILHWSPTSTLTVEGGGEFAYELLRTRPDYSDNGAPDRHSRGERHRSRKKRGEAFTTATWRPTPKFTVEAGLRLEDSTIASSGDVALSKSLFYPKPRVVLTWSPDADNQLRLRVEREVGQLDFKNFTAAAALNSNGVTAGNPNLVPQTDWAFEAAFDHHFMKSGVISLTVRHLILEDVVDRVPQVFSPSGDFDEPGNIGGGSENDITASFTVPLQRPDPRRRNPPGTVNWQMFEGDRPHDPRTAPDFPARTRCSAATCTSSQDLPLMEAEVGHRRQPRQPAALLPVR